MLLFICSKIIYLENDQYCVNLNTNCKSIIIFYIYIFFYVLEQSLILKLLNFPSILIPVLVLCYNDLDTLPVCYTPCSCTSFDTKLSHIVWTRGTLISFFLSCHGTIYFRPYHYLLPSHITLYPSSTLPFPFKHQRHTRIHTNM